MSSAEITTPSNSIFNRYHTGERATQSIQSDQIPSAIGWGLNLASRKPATLNQRIAAASNAKSAIDQFQLMIVTGFKVGPKD